MSPTPTLRLERTLLRSGCARVAGVDEVGRGAVAGPVAVGVVVVTAASGTAPQGLRDSKLLTPQARRGLLPKVRRWASENAVGQATADEIDEWGLMAALRLAALRALHQIGHVDVIVLDGSHDWLSPADDALFDPVPWPDVVVPRVITLVKADLKCSSVAAASVIAKVTRDDHMIGLHVDHPQFGWDVNKGYCTADHSEAIRSHGLCVQHRQSWQVAAAIELRDDPGGIHMEPRPGLVPSSLLEP